MHPLVVRIDILGVHGVANGIRLAGIVNSVVVRVGELARGTAISVQLIGSLV